MFVFSYSCKASMSISERSRLFSTNNESCMPTVHILIGLARACVHQRTSRLPYIWLRTAQFKKKNNNNKNKNKKIFLAPEAQFLSRFKNKKFKKTQNQCRLSSDAETVESISAILLNEEFRQSIRS